MSKIIIQRLAIKLGWRGKRCKHCNFYHAAHIDPTVQWRPSYYPCSKYEPKS